MRFLMQKFFYSYCVTCTLLGMTSSHKPRMDGCEYVMDSWGYGASLISHPRILCHAPYFDQGQRSRDMTDLVVAPKSLLLVGK